MACHFGRARYLCALALVVSLVGCFSNKNNNEASSGPAPYVDRTSPQDGDTNVPVNIIVTWHFNVPVQMSSSGFAIWQQNAQSTMSGNMYTSDNQTFTFVSSYYYPSWTRMFCSIENAVNNSGAVCQNTFWSFQTGGNTQSGAPGVQAMDAPAPSGRVASGNSTSQGEPSSQQEVLVPHGTLTEIREGTSVDLSGMYFVGTCVSMPVPQNHSQTSPM